MGKGILAFLSTDINHVIFTHRVFKSGQNLEACYFATKFSIGISKGGYSMKKATLGLVLVLSAQSVLATGITSASAFGGKRMVEGYNYAFTPSPEEEGNFFQKGMKQVIPSECKNLKKNEDTVLVKGERIYCKELPIKTISKEQFRKLKSNEFDLMAGNTVKIPERFNNENPAETGKVGGAVNSIIMVIDKLIAIGQKIIPTIKEGKSVVTSNPMAAISVLPRTENKDFVVHEMGNWSIPKTALFKVAYSNGFGSEVVQFTYAVTFQYGGTHKGKGKYLNGIRVSPKNINVTWGFDLDATSQLIAISNVGSEENVIAGASVEIVYTVKNWMKHISTADGFFVDGRGQIYRVN